MSMFGERRTCSSMNIIGDVLCSIECDNVPWPLMSMDMLRDRSRMTISIRMTEHASSWLITIELLHDRSLSIMMIIDRCSMSMFDGRRTCSSMSVIEYDHGRRSIEHDHCAFIGMIHSDDHVRWASNMMITMIDHEHHYGIAEKLTCWCVECYIHSGHMRKITPQDHRPRGLRPI